MEGCMLGCLNRVHTGERRAVLKQLEGYHTERIDIHFEVVWLMPEDLRRHVAVRPCLACQLELGFQVVAGMLVDRQRLGQAEVSQLDGACVIDETGPAFEQAL